MKNQYFGDVRDLFKYDLMECVIKKTGSIRHLLFIPMLTKDNDKKGEGEKRDYDNAKAGCKNNNLRKHLKNCKRDIKEIQPYFKKLLGDNIYIQYEHFVNTNRKEYFKILKELEEVSFSNSLIFFDPDNGLEVSKPSKKHLKYSEVKCSYNRMDKNSIIMIYQHFPRARKKNRKYMPEGRSKRLKKELGNSPLNLPLYISDNEIFFLFLTKNKKLKEKLAKILVEYVDDNAYEKLDVEECRKFLRGQ